MSSIKAAVELARQHEKARIREGLTGSDERVLLGAEACDEICRALLVATADNEHLREERDEALADGVLSARVCEIQNEKAQLEADNARLRGEVERMRAVYEAAMKWRNNRAVWPGDVTRDHELVAVFDASQGKEASKP